MFSKNTLLPGFGAFGLISSAGSYKSVFVHEYTVAPTVHNRAIITLIKVYSILNSNITFGSTYIIAYISVIILGNKLNPIISPTTDPIIVASSA